VDVKLGSKAFNERPTEPARKGPLNHTASPLEMKSLGGEDLGEVLNKTSDPNWIDPSKKIRTVGNDKLDKDAFMKLMLAQMKNQDPTNPLKSHEMAAQLAQFSSLEQLQNINTSLDTMKSGQKPQETVQALNYIGKAVAGDSSAIIRGKGDRNHDFVFNLPDAAQTAEVKVKNAEGEVIRSVKLHDLKKGENSYSWNGVNDRDLPQPVGEYKFELEAVNSAGKKLAVKTDFAGTITGVNYTSEGPVLLIGNQAIKMKDVKKIIDPALLVQKKDQPVQNATPAELKTSEPVSQNEEKGTKKFIPGVAMTRDLMNSLQAQQLAAKTDEGKAKQ
jgi:flagellar basal-body rod modification protein FlgD